MFKEKTKEILMALQYRFPVSRTPFADLASDLRVNERDLLREVRRLSAEGVIKRIGAYLSYRAEGKESYLVAVRTDDRVGSLLEKELLRRNSVSHNYLRRHHYNMWFVVKGHRALDEIREIVSRYDLSDHVVLRSVRTYKLAVKFDLWRGVSRSPQGMLPHRTSSPEDLNLNPEVLRSLKILPLVSRPFLKIAERFGTNEDDLLNLIERFLKEGILTDYGAALDGDKLDFKVNLMVMLGSGDPNRTCERICTEVPEATHVILREPIDREWPYRSYCVLHAVDLKLLEKSINKLSEISADLVIAPSERNLKPGVIR